nr:MAG TPA: hypothetical protein [Caudoviricetes sp.]
METAKFLKEATRMCRAHNCCDGCPANDGHCVARRQKDKDDFAKYVAIVEKWSNEHPVKTRQSEFLKMFPNAQIKDDYVDICPRKIEGIFDCPPDGINTCTECKRKYWLTEVE